MRIVKMIGPAALALAGLCLLIGAAGASAVVPTGVCNAEPGKECKAGTYFAKGETFTGTNLGNVVITDKKNTIECKKSTLVLTDWEKIRAQGPYLQKSLKSNGKNAQLSGETRVRLNPPLRKTKHSRGLAYCSGPWLARQAQMEPIR